MVHWSIVGCNNRQGNNSEVTYFNLPKDPQRRKDWLAAIGKDKGNLPSNVFLCSDHFEDKYFDKSWGLQNWLFYTDRPIKRKLISTVIPTLLPHKRETLLLRRIIFVAELFICFCGLNIRLERLF